MTQKELLYLEDAIGHEKTIVSVLQETINMLEDEDLKDYIAQDLETHQSIQDDLTTFLEDKANE